MPSERHGELIFKDTIIFLLFMLWGRGITGTGHTVGDGNAVFRLHDFRKGFHVRGSALKSQVIVGQSEAHLEQCSLCDNKSVTTSPFAALYPDFK